MRVLYSHCRGCSRISEISSTCVAAVAFQVILTSTLQSSHTTSRQEEHKRDRQPLWASHGPGETGRRSPDPVEGPAGHWHVHLVSTVSDETLAPLSGTQLSQLVGATVRRHSIASFPDSRSGLGSGLYSEASPFGSLPHQVWSL